MTDLERILEDAYQLGRTDATLDVNDHDLLMPKMLAKAVKYQAEAVREARIEQLEKLTIYGGAYLDIQIVNKEIADLKREQG